MPSVRSVVRRLAQLLVVGVALLAALEVTARIHLFGFSGLVPERINSWRLLHETKFLQPSPLPGLRHELKPNLEGYFRMVPFRTNARGLRDREYALKKPEHCFRVAVIGSSFSMPEGVAIEDAWHSLLEERLSEELAPTSYQFVNFAVGMLSSKHMLAILESRALAYQPDLIVYTVTRLSTPALHRAERHARLPARRPKGPPKLPRVRRSPPEKRPNELEGLPRLQHDFPVLDSFLVRLVSSRFTPIRHTGRQAGLSGRGVLERLAAIEQRTGIPIVVVRLEFESRPKSPYEIAIEAQSRQHGIPYLDTRDAFRGTRYRDLWLNALDAHPSARAHAIFADTIDAFLRAQTLLPGASS